MNWLRKRTIRKARIKALGEIFDFLEERLDREVLGIKIKFLKEGEE